MEDKKMAVVVNFLFAILVGVVTHLICKWVDKNEFIKNIFHE